MQVKETMQTQDEAAVPHMPKTSEISALRAWRTPVFTRLPLKEALSSLEGEGSDTVGYS